MPRFTHYPPRASYLDTKGRVIAIPCVPGIAWWIGDSVSNVKSHAQVHVVSLPVGHAFTEHWSTLRNRIDAGTLIVMSEQVYDTWQDAAFTVYRALALPYITTADPIEKLVASIEGVGQSAGEPELC